MNKHTERFLIGLCIGLFVVGVLWAGSSHAQVLGPTPQPIKFCDVCAGFTVSKRGNDVLIRCPGRPLDKPWMTLQNCVNPKVDRTQPSNVSINCNYPPPGFVPPPKVSLREMVLYRDMRPVETYLTACVNPTGGKG